MSVTGRTIAERALLQVGTAFRKNGRLPDVGLDCVGLVGHALALDDISNDYSLRGDHMARIEDYFRRNFCIVLSPGDAVVPGDIAAVCCAPAQVHLLVRTDQGWVHAHAGLRRVVITPDPLPWPVLSIWRYRG